MVLVTSDGSWSHTRLTGGLSRALMPDADNSQCLHWGLLKGGAELPPFRTVGCAELIALGSTLSLACVSDALHL